MAFSLGAMEQACAMESVLSARARELKILAAKPCSWDDARGEWATMTQGKGIWSAMARHRFLFPVTDAIPEKESGDKSPHSKTAFRRYLRCDG
jgi:hypothetical protein